MLEIFTDGVRRVVHWLQLKEWVRNLHTKAEIIHEGEIPLLSLNQGDDTQHNQEIESPEILREKAMFDRQVQRSLIEKYQKGRDLADKPNYILNRTNDDIHKFVWNNWYL